MWGPWATLSPWQGAESRTQPGHREGAGLPSGTAEPAPQTGLLGVTGRLRPLGGPPGRQETTCSWG